MIGLVAFTLSTALGEFDQDLIRREGSFVYRPSEEEIAARKHRQEQLNELEGIRQLVGAGRIDDAYARLDRLDDPLKDANPGLIAEIAVCRGDALGAVKLLERTSDRTNRQLALAYFYAGRTEEARDQYDTSFAMGYIEKIALGSGFCTETPSNGADLEVGLLMDRGIEAYYHVQFGLARIYFDKATSIRPDYALPHYFAAKCDWHTGLCAEAELGFSNAQRLGSGVFRDAVKQQRMLLLDYRRSRADLRPVRR